MQRFFAGGSTQCASYGNSPLTFFKAWGIDAETVADCQATIRHRVLRLFVRRGLLEADDAKLMGEWAHDGGFSLDASVRIEVGI